MRVMVFGTFDNLHPGHLDYFRQARRFGEELIAVVARDKNVLRIKGRAAQENERTRLKKVRAALKEIRGVAVLGVNQNQWVVLRKYRPDIICLGYDQKVDMKRLKSEIEKSGLRCKIKRMKAHYPERYKSSYCRGDGQIRVVK